jgi:hypothetical protein
VTDFSLLDRALDHLCADEPLLRVAQLVRGTLAPPTPRFIEQLLALPFPDPMARTRIRWPSPAERASE